MSTLRWIPLKKPIIRGKKNRIVLRFTEGDSEWLDASARKFLMVVKSHEWNDDAVSATDILKRFYGSVPDAEEPGRVVFDLPAAECDFNERRRRYFYKIYSSTSMSFTDNTPVAQGYFEVVNGSRYNNPLGGSNG